MLRLFSLRSERDPFRFLSVCFSEQKKGMFRFFSLHFASNFSFRFKAKRDRSYFACFRSQLFDSVRPNFSFSLQRRLSCHGHAVWTWLAVWTYSTDMGLQHRHTEWARSNEIQHEHAAFTRCKNKKHRQAAGTFLMDKQCRHAARTCSIT